MFLKSLEVRGFKSFADKTELEFKKGVTAKVIAPFLVGSQTTRAVVNGSRPLSIHSQEAKKLFKSIAIIFLFEYKLFFIRHFSL